MKNKTKRILSAFLAIITLLSVFMVVGCSKDDINAGGEAQNTVSSYDEINLPQTRVPDDLRFDGQINEVEAGRHQDYFADYIRGLDTFGAKVIDEARIQVIKVPVA